MKEEWRPVVGWEGLYEVSDQGRVRSLDREVILPNSRPYIRKGRILSAADNGNGYLVVRLCHQCRVQMKTVHGLVAESFIGPRPTGKEVRHDIGGQQDNRLANLCYGTRYENSKDKIRDGTYLRGESVPTAVLTAKEVKEICRRLVSGESQVHIAEDYDVHKATINAIAVGKSWSHISGWKNLKPGHRKVLSEAQREEICRLSESETDSELSRKFNVSRTTIRNVRQETK